MTLYQLCIVVIALALLPAALHTLSQVLGLALHAMRVVWWILGFGLMAFMFYSFNAVIYRVCGESVPLSCVVWVGIAAFLGLYARYAPVMQAAYERMSALRVLLLATGGAALVVGLSLVFYVVTEYDRHPEDVAPSVIGCVVSLWAAIVFLMAGMSGWGSRGSEGPDAPGTLGT